MKRQSILVFLFVALVGALTGVSGGNRLGRFMLLRSTEKSLQEYADQLTHSAETYAVEVDSVWRAFNPSPYPFCSPQEITAMRAVVFRSLQVKDIGRTRDGKLYCSAEAGRIDPPYSLPPDAMLLANRATLYTDLSFSGSSVRGAALELNGVNVLISPKAFDYWVRPHTQYAVFIVNPATHRFAQIGGAQLDVSPRWMIGTQREQTRRSVYLTKCSDAIKVCVVTTETRNDAYEHGRDLLYGYSWMGGLVGLNVTVALGLVLSRPVGRAKQLRRAIQRNAIRLVYQQIVELPSRRIIGAEALARWSDASGVPVSPELFVRIAEDGGFIYELTATVLHRAIEECGELLRQNPDFVLSINIAVSDLLEERLYRSLEWSVRNARIRPEQIALEMTERSTADLALVRQAIERLHWLGYKVFIDDFGTGFSSLGYLQELAVDAVKIDTIFTRAIGTDAVTASILPQILSMAESLKFGVIVEGVESEAQVQFLETSRDSVQVQGWYFGKAVGVEELRESLLESKVQAS